MIATVPSRETVIFHVVISPTIYHAWTSHSTSKVILSLNKALPTIWSTPILGIRSAIACSHSMVLVKVFLVVSNLSTFASSVIIDAVVYLMTVAHLYCNHAQKPYTQTNRIHIATRYFIERFIKIYKKLNS
ncbi:MAG: hypothetical protein WCL02_00300 [bacterium]